MAPAPPKTLYRAFHTAAGFQVSVNGTPVGIFHPSAVELAILIQQRYSDWYARTRWLAVNEGIFVSHDIKHAESSKSAVTSTRLNVRFGAMLGAIQGWHLHTISHLPCNCMLNGLRIK